MKYFKEGQKVYCAVYGEGIVERINIDDYDIYPITVYFESTDEYVNYTVEGKYIGDNITLSQNPIPPIVNEIIQEHELSFAEAMELVLRGEKLNCKLWLPEEYIKIEDDVVQFYYFNPKHGDFNYIVQADEIKAKWRIIE